MTKTKKSKVPSAKHLVRLLHARLGRQPSHWSLPGLFPTETYELYATLGRVVYALKERR